MEGFFACCLGSLCAVKDGLVAHEVEAVRALLHLQPERSVVRFSRYHTVEYRTSLTFQRFLRAPSNCRSDNLSGIRCSISPGGLPPTPIKVHNTCGGSISILILCTRYETFTTRPNVTTPGQLTKNLIMTRSTRTHVASTLPPPRPFRKPRAAPTSCGDAQFPDPRETRASSSSNSSSYET